MSEGKRAACFLALAAVILLGPAYPQLAGGGQCVLRPWDMFLKKKMGTRWLELWRVRPDGSEERLDRFAYAHGKHARLLGARHVHAPRQALAIAHLMARKLCSVESLHVRLREATPQGWSLVLDRQVRAGRCEEER